jgi:hypothetical protein
VPTADERERFINNEVHFDIKPTTAYLLETLLTTIDEIAEIIAKRTWTLVTFDEPALFTGEHPLVHINPSGGSLGYGVVTAEQLYLPISTRHGLLMSHPWTSWPEATVHGTPELAERLNWATFTHPSNNELLLHPDVAVHRMPRPSLIVDRGWSPWGEDPEAAPPAGR